jgi:hypothetical protein
VAYDESHLDELGCYDIYPALPHIQLTVDFFHDIEKQKQPRKQNKHARKQRRMPF